MTAKVRLTARIGAVLFVAGASCAVPYGMATATADDSDNSPASSTSDAAKASPSPRAGRTGNPASRGTAARGAQAPRASAAGTDAGHDAVPVPETPAPEAKASRTRPVVVHEVESPSSPVLPAAEPTPSIATPPQAAATYQPDAAAEVDSSTTTVHSRPSRSPEIAAAQPVPAATEDPVPAASGTVATVSASAAAAKTSTAALIDKLLAPIKTLFGEGTALLVRRSLFNQAPSVTPVQLTGQSTGPITGKIGAIDLEGDPLTYTIASKARFGTAVVNPDGTYTYTPGDDFTGTDSFGVTVSDGGRRLNILDLSRPSSTAARVAVAQGAVAALLQFQFVYGSGSQYWSSDARTALEAAASRLASYFVVDSPVTITYAVTGKSSPFSSTLATAGSDFVNDGSGFLPTVVQAKVLTGVDANGASADGTIDWNFGPAWSFGSTVSNSQYDFESIATHELLHTMGFLSNIDKAGSNTGTLWTVFDSYVTNSAGTAVINSDTKRWNSAYNANLTGGSGGLYFNGPNAVAAYHAAVPLYTPNPWAPGSSLSHLDDDTFTGSQDKLMNAFTGQGLGIRVLSPIEIGILTDIGYTLTSGPGVPTLLFAGFFVLRRRRR